MASNNTVERAASTPSPVQHEGLYLNLPSVDCISVDLPTGKGHFKLPLARLAEVELGEAFELAITSPCSQPGITLVPVGTWSQSFKMLDEWDGTKANWDYTLTFSSMPHTDGRSIDATLNNYGREEGAGFVLDAASFAEKRLAFANTQEAGERSLTEAQLDKLTDAQLQAHKERYSHFKEIDDRYVGLIAKNGAAHIFECAGTGKAGTRSNMLLRHFVAANGRALTFTWDNRMAANPRLAAIDDDNGRLATFTWMSDQQFALMVFPDSTEQVNYDCSIEDNAWVVNVTGADPLAQKQVYRIDSSDNRINGVELSTFYNTGEAQETVRVDSETLTYRDGKIASRSLSLANGLASERCEYTYETDKTTQVFKRGTQTMATHVHAFKNGQPASTTVTSNGVTTVSRQALVLDTENGIATLTTHHEVDGQEQLQSTATFDVMGNLVKLAEGSQVTEWSYFNNYKHYEVEEWRVAKGESGFGAWMYRSLFGVVFSDILPLQLGSDRGVTSSVWTLSSVRAASSPCDYAKKAFNLPMDIKYPGDFYGFTAHVESQKISRIVDGQEQVEQVTYFGYGSLACTPRKGLTRTHLVVPTVKLTVVDPDIETIDLSAIQLALATAAAKDWLASLDKQIAKAQGAEEKKLYQAQKANLQQSLKAQSKLNAVGFKLNSLTAARIQVEVLDYQTDVAQPGHGKVKSQTIYLLDNDGNEVSGSKSVTSLKHSIDVEDKLKVSIATTVKTESLELTSSQTRSGYAGQLLETVDSQGLKRSWSIGKNGLVKCEQVGDETQALQNTVYSTVLLDGGLIRYQSVDGQSGAGQRVVVDGLGREQRVEVSWDGSNWLPWAQFVFDAQGRQSSVTEYDYDAAGERLFTHTISWTYDDAKGSSTINHLLVGADGAELDSRVEVVITGDEGVTRTHGTFKQHRHYDPQSRCLTLTQGNADGKGATLKRQVLFAADGLPCSSTTSSVVGGVESRLQSITSTYNSQGLLSSLDLDIDQQCQEYPGELNCYSSYCYDRFGRLTRQEENGHSVGYTYSPFSLSDVALTVSSKKVLGSEEFDLGSQTVDELGRVKTRFVNGVLYSYDYTGAEHFAAGNYIYKTGLYKLKVSDAEGAETLDGYSSAWDEDSLRYTEICPLRATLLGDESESASTTTHYSRRGRVLSVTDVLGYVTAYTYDAYGRVSTMSNAACITSLTYADSGLLLQEVVSDLVSGLSMTVTYAYDVGGNELSRTFECPGIATHTLSRTLLADGRLGEAVLVVGGVMHSSDKYSYDQHGRLIEWVACNKSYRYSLNKLISKQEFDYDNLGNVTWVSLASTSGGGGAEPFEVVTSINREYVGAIPGLLCRHGEARIPADSCGRWILGAPYNAAALFYYPNSQLAISYSADKSGRYHEYGYDDVGMLRGVFDGEGDKQTSGYLYHYREGKIYARTRCTADDRHALVLLNDSPSCLLQMSRDKDGKSVSTFELRDAAGSIFATISRNGDIEYHSYSPYGHREFDESSNHWLGFKGEAVLPNGTYYLGSQRVYNPYFMSFQSPDSWSPFGAGGPAAYAYCGGDPVNYHDPSGHQMVAHYQRQEAIPAMYTKEFRIGMAVAGVVMAPFTGGASLQMTMAITGLAALSAGFEIASVMLEDSDPQLSQAMGTLGFAFGMASMAAGFSAVERSAGVGTATRLRARPMNRNRPVAMGGPIEDINPLDKGVHYVVDSHKGGKRLSITGHGIYVDFLDTYLMAGDQKNFTPSKLLVSLKASGVDPKDFDHLRLLMCHSADSTASNDAFAATFAKLAKKNVKAYHGKVYVNWSSDTVSDMFFDPANSINSVDWVAKQRAKIISYGDRQVVHFKKIRTWRKLFRKHPNPLYRPEVFYP